MPFKSEAQRRWMYATHPRMAKRWQKETKSKDLPERVKEASLAAFFDELEKMSAMGVDLRVKGDGGVRRPPFATEGSKSLATNQFNQSRRVAQLGAAPKPPTPNIRGVATMVR